MKHRIREVKKDSIADELAIRPGDFLCEIGGRPVEDVFDYEFMCREEYLEVLIESAEGEAILFEIEKDETEDLGLVFEEGLMDQYRSCRNKCIFCFIDQMPPGMRETLYFKDDDARLSFLQGNYITLTNLSDKDVERIIRYHLSPINISIHTMNPELRNKMLHNRFAGNALALLDEFASHGITMNGQIVLCPGYNDGPELDETIRKLTGYLPYMESVSVVPVGMTKFREGLAPLKPVSREKAAECVEMIEKWQKIIYDRCGMHFIHASDEFYLLAGLPLPEEARYDGYLQLENGVGMLRLFMDGFRKKLRQLKGSPKRRHLSLATGTLSAGVMKELIAEMGEKYPNVQVTVYPIVNHFFGESITVAGLVTGQDLIAQLKGRDLGEILLIPDTMLRAQEDVFLDDVHLSEVRQALGTEVIPLATRGETLLNNLLGLKAASQPKLYRPYEPGGKYE